MGKVKYIEDFLYYLNLYHKDTLEPISIIGDPRSYHTYKINDKYLYLIRDSYVMILNSKNNKIVNYLEDIIPNFIKIFSFDPELLHDYIIKILDKQERIEPKFEIIKENIFDYYLNLDLEKDVVDVRSLYNIIRVDNIKDPFNQGIRKYITSLNDFLGVRIRINLSDIESSSVLMDTISNINNRVEKLKYVDSVDITNDMYYILVYVIIDINRI